MATSGGWLRPALRISGAGLLAATAAIHLDLYLTGYRNIPTIGWLFLLQVIAGFALAVAVLATGNQVVAALGAGFAVSTLAGYLLSIWFGLFGFKEVRTTAGIVAGIIEVAAFAVLALLAVTPAPAGRAATGGRGGQALAQMLDGLPMAKPADDAAANCAHTARTGRSRTLCQNAALTTGMIRGVAAGDGVSNNRWYPRATTTPSPTSSAA